MGDGNSPPAEAQRKNTAAFAIAYNHNRKISMAQPSIVKTPTNQRKVSSNAPKEVSKGNFVTPRKEPFGNIRNKLSATK